MNNAADSRGIRELALRQMPAALTGDERERAAVYLDLTLHPPGEVNLGGTSTKMSGQSCALFVDGKPGGNWMHPCRYLLMDTGTGACTGVDADRPPAFGPLPPSWSLLWRAPGVEDWQQLPLTSASAT